MNLEEITSKLNQLKVERAATDADYKQAERDINVDRMNALKEIDGQIETLKQEAENILNSVGVKSAKTSAGTIKKIEYDSSKASNWSWIKKLGKQETRDVVGHVESIDPSYIKVEEVKKLDDSRIKSELASGLLINYEGNIINTETGEVLCEALFQPKESSIVTEEA